jgi:hypothetical protein
MVEVLFPPPKAPAADAVIPPSPRPSEDRLSAQIEVHDRQQLELRLHYVVGGAAERQRYTVDTYLFVPRNVGVNRGNYSRDQFYADVTSLMRLDAEPLPLDLLADVSYPSSPLHALAKAVVDFRASPRPPPSRPVVIHVKLYANLFVFAIKSELKKLTRRVSRVSSDEDGEKYERKLERTLQRIIDALAAFRRIRAAFWPFEDMSHQSLRDALRNADEYMSLVLEERLTAVVDALETQHALPGTGFTARCRLRLTALVRDETAYRRRYGYLALCDDGRGDFFSYRMSLLKKAVQQALYLDPRAVEVDTFRKNAVGAVAAALAATWALASQLPSTLASVSGSTKIIVTAAAVMAYVTKDRIKAITSEYLSKKLKRFDHTYDITGGSLAAVGLGMLHASIGETMRFLHVSEVPADIFDLRIAQRTMRTAEVAGEEVIHHRKSVDLDNSEEGSPLPEGYSVRDILRLNVRHFLVRLDEPEDQLRYFDWKRDAYSLARLPKVYHLNLVVKTRRLSTNGLAEGRLDRIRVVLNKEGIVRVELVESRSVVERA